jgi:hypothetical protein
VPFAIRVYDGRHVFKGVWWQADKDSEPEPLYLDDWAQGLADNKLDDVRTNFPNIAPVLDGDELRSYDWLDFLVWKARPSLHVQVEQVEGPIETDLGSAEELMAWAQAHPEPVPDAAMIKRTWSPIPDAVASRSVGPRVEVTLSTGAPDASRVTLLDLLFGSRGG